MDGKKNVIINNIISIFISLVLVIIILFIYNMFMAPKQLVLTKIEYEPINRNEYSVNDNALDGTLFDTKNFQFSDTDLDRYEDLKDYYKGRDNPFVASESKDDIIIPKEKEDKESEDGQTTIPMNNGNDDIDTILD